MTEERGIRTKTGMQARHHCSTWSSSSAARWIGKEEHAYNTTRSPEKAGRQPVRQRANVMQTHEIRGRARDTPLVIDLAVPLAKHVCKLFTYIVPRRRNETSDREEGTSRRDYLPRA